MMNCYEDRLLQNYQTPQAYYNTVFNTPPEIWMQVAIFEKKKEFA
jgi:hypothetical protein